MNSKQVYENMPWIAEHLQLANFWLEPIRQIGWWLLLGLGTVLDGIYDAYMALLKINIQSIVTDQLGRVSGGVKDLWPLVLTLSITVMGILIMVTAKKRKEIGNGIAVAILLLVCGPMLFSTFNNFLSSAVPWVEESFTTYVAKVVYGYGGEEHEIIESKTRDTAISGQIITYGSFDLLYSAQVNTLSEITDPKSIRINERMGGYFGNNDLFPYKVDSISSSGIAYGRELKSDAWIMEDFQNEGLYRYKFSFFGPFFTMIIMILGIGLGGFKTAKLMFELVFTQTLAPLVFASDLTNAGRSKEVVKKIMSTYILIAIVFYGLMLFMTLSLWALEQENILVRLLLLTGFAWGMVDGPDIVVRLLGIDAGVRSGFGAVVGAGMAVGGVARLAGSAGKLVGDAGKLARGGKNFVSGVSERIQTKMNAPPEVNQALKGATSESKKAFHDPKSNAYHNVDALDYKKSYRGVSGSSNAPSVQTSAPSKSPKNVSTQGTTESKSPNTRPRSRGSLGFRPKESTQSGSIKSNEYDALEIDPLTNRPKPPDVPDEFDKPSQKPDIKSSRSSTSSYEPPRYLPTKRIQDRETMPKGGIKNDARPRSEHDNRRKQT